MSMKPTRGLIQITSSSDMRDTCIMIRAAAAQKADPHLPLTQFVYPARTGIALPEAGDLSGVETVKDLARLLGSASRRLAEPTEGVVRVAGYRFDDPAGEVGIENERGDRHVEALA